MGYANITCLKQAVSVAIGAICVIGMGSPVRAEPISDSIVEQAPGHSVKADAWPEALGSPPSSFGGAANEEDDTTGVKSAPGPLGRDSPSLPPTNRESKLPLTPSRSQTSEQTRPPRAAANVDADWLLDREIKEAVRPLYEDLKSSGVVEAMRDLKSDLGLDGRSSLGDPASSGDANARGNGSPAESVSTERLDSGLAPQDRPRSATQREQDKLVAAARWKELIEEIRPWLFGLAGLYVLGYITKLGLEYSRQAAIRSARRASRGTRRHRRHRRPSGNIDKSSA